MVEYRPKKKYNIKAIQFNEYNNYTLLQELENLKMVNNNNLIDYQQTTDKCIVIEIETYSEHEGAKLEILELKKTNYLIVSWQGLINIMSQSEFKKHFELERE